MKFEFVGEEMWTDNWTKGLMADIWLGINATNEKIMSANINKAINMNTQSTADQYVMLCKACDRLWEIQISSWNNVAMYVPKCNSIRIGKKEKICPNCR